MATLTKEDYLLELIDIALKLTDYSNLVKQGNDSYFKEMALKLRLLYIDKSRTKSLLRKVSGAHKLSILVWVIDTPEEQVAKGEMSPEMAASIILSLTNSVLTWFDSGSFQVDPFTALDRIDILLDDEQYSYREIIEVVADKKVAHIDSTYPDRILKLDEMVAMNLSGVHRVIFDTSETSIILINAICDCINNNAEYEFIERICD